jgi:predicted MPP superfamily phosphohydrolase
MVLSRREFLLGSSATLGATHLTVGNSGAANFNRFFTTDEIKLEEITIASPTTPREFDGYRIGFITDIHLSFAIPNEWVEQAAGILYRAGIDLLLIGGDNLWIPDQSRLLAFGDKRNRSFDSLGSAEMASGIYSQLAQILGQFKFKDGSYGVRGNHDVWHNSHACQEIFARSNIQTLINQFITIKRGAASLQIIGVDDYWNGLPLIPKLPRLRSELDYRVLLSHNPDFVANRLKAPETEWQENSFDLALCGHTHGGQIRLPGIGALSYNIQHREFGKGLRITPRCQVYTSRGLGVVELPFRINCPAEVTVLTLRTT